MPATDMPGPVHRPPCTCIEPITDAAKRFGGGLASCVCGDVERCLRGWAAKYPMPAMTPDQRTWALAEIRACGDSTDQPSQSVVEHYMDDARLADAVLRAWQDYARDKGLI